MNAHPTLDSRKSASLPRRIAAANRPHGDLMTYYFLRSLALGPFFFLLLIPSWFRYHTLRYRFDEEGISMAWGILFRREIHLTYARIQDIHLVSNVVERWLGLARIQIQTASGSARAEMTLEGLKEFQLIRDFVYSRMRGTGERRTSASAQAASTANGAALPEDVAAELTTALREVAAELRVLRGRLPRTVGTGREEGSDV